MWHVGIIVLALFNFPNYFGKGKPKKGIHESKSIKLIFQVPGSGSQFRIQKAIESGPETLELILGWPFLIKRSVETASKESVRLALFVFLLQNIGIIVGILCLFTLAKFQDDIQLSSLV